MYPKDFFRDGNIEQWPRTCFVMMPFAPDFDDVYETIRQAMEAPELDFVCRRADELRGGGHIIEGILRQIGQAEIVIADLTGRNPNVFYELGIVQMVKDVEKVILLSQNAESIPFDVSMFRNIIYERSADGAKELKKTLTENVKAVAEHSVRFTVGDRAKYSGDEIIGPDRFAYRFEISPLLIARNGGKFRLRVTRHTGRKGSEAVFDDTWGLTVGERRSIPGLEWDLYLEGVKDKHSAQFAAFPPSPSKS